MGLHCPVCGVRIGHGAPPLPPLRRAVLRAQYPAEPHQQALCALRGNGVGGPHLLAQPRLFVLGAGVTANDNRDIVFVEAGDLNDDGEVDYYSYYPNGDRQVIYVFP